jgi:SAM-dependent methyltransferase
MTADAASRLYEEKERGYYAAARMDLLRLLPPGGGLRVLELGAGDGATLRAARETGLASYTVGIDLAEPEGGAPGVDRFIHGNFEALDPDLPAGGFDAVLCADVLEHLVDPWRTVARLAGWLRPGGVFLSSIPNIRNHRALRAIVLQGDFRYAPAGLLDRSHLRFFCRRNIRELFEGAGLVVEAMEENMGGYGLRHRALDALTFGRLHDFFVFQYRTRARKP